MIRTRLAPLAAAALCACGSSDPASTAAPISTSAVDPGNAGGNKLLSVMTRNLYVGGNLLLPFVAPDPLLAASTVWGDILASDPPARMAAIAEEIRAARPDLVGVQEGYRFIVTPLGKTAPVLLDLDYLALLEAALAADPDDARFRLVASHPQTTITVPFPDRGVQITMIDHDAILAGPGVLVRATDAGSFDADFHTTLAGVIPVVQKRGWVEAKVKHQGVPFTFVATHLEVKELGPIQSLQAMELAGRFGSTEPTVLVGDTNSDPHDPPYVVSGVPAPIPTPYQILTVPFRDAAPAVGNTCCFAADLRPPSSLYERVDLVLVRGAVTPRSAYRVGLAPLAELGGRWPSDHAGVVGKVRLELPRFYALGR